MAVMADPEKFPSGVQSDRVSNTSSKIAKPNTWKYRSPKVGPIKLPWFASPISQLIIVSFVCFLCPGMFNALSGMGGGGQIDNDTVDKANTALYSTFAVVGFFAGSITNVIGIKLALSFGGTGYCLYIASFLCFSHTHNKGFNIFAGAFLGVCAGMLWSAQGAIMMSYPTEESKGRYISYFWMIFNLGAVIGGLVPLGENLDATGNSTVTDETYIGFIVLTFCGALLSFCLVNAKDVVRPDGSKVILMKNPTWQSELKGLLVTFKQDPWIVLLFPMFWSSNWFYTYQFNDVNNAYFSTRASALNSILYWICQILGAGSFGWALDLKSVSRPLKAKIAWCALLVLTMAIWGGGYVFQRNYTRETVDPEGPFVPMDWKTSGYVGPMFLYMFYGFYDAAWQTCVYWFMGALTNNGRKLANFAGFYKGIQSAGAAVIWALDYRTIPFMHIFASCWGLLAGSLLIALPTIMFKVRPTVTVEQDLKFSDESYEDVAPQVGRSNSHAMGHVAEQPSDYPDYGYNGTKAI